MLPWTPQFNEIRSRRLLVSRPQRTKVLMKIIWEAWIPVHPDFGGGIYRETGVEEDQAIDRLLKLLEREGYRA